MGLDLTTNPDIVMQPEISARILVKGMMQGWFTTKKLTQYVNEDTVDFNSARRVVNGMDKNKQIASIAYEYLEELDG